MDIRSYLASIFASHPCLVGLENLARECLVCGPFSALNWQVSSGKVRERERERVRPIFERCQERGLGVLRLLCIKQGEGEQQQQQWLHLSSLAVAQPTRPDTRHGKLVTVMWASQATTNLSLQVYFDCHTRINIVYWLFLPHNCQLRVKLTSHTRMCERREKRWSCYEVLNKLLCFKCVRCVPTR